MPVGVAVAIGVGVEDPGEFGGADFGGGGAVVVAVGGTRKAALVRGSSECRRGIEGGRAWEGEGCEDGVWEKGSIFWGGVRGVGVKFVTGCLVGVSGLALGQFRPAPIEVSGEFALAAGLDGGGEVARGSVRTRLSAPLFLSEELIVGLVGEYEWNWYDFSGGAPELWGEVHEAQLGVAAISRREGGWNWLLSPSVRSGMEGGGDFGESLTFGGVGGAWYEISERLSLGVGVGWATELEDDFVVFPLPFVRWEFVEDWTLATGPAVGFRTGPSVHVTWRPQEEWSLMLGYFYESERFRLDEDSAVAANGVGEVEESRVAAALTYRSSENLAVTLHASLGLGGEYEVEDARGAGVFRAERDAAVTVGLGVSWDF
ncbi:MAG: hypothetical protein AAGC74_07180 [Verrucomicrobiota bacterium]